MFQLGDRLPLTKATCVRLIPIKLRALVLVQICNREAVMRTNISTDPGKRPRLLGELGELSHRRVRSAEYKYGRGAEIFGAEEPADYLYQVIEGAVRSYKLLVAAGRRFIWRAISSAVNAENHMLLLGRKTSLERVAAFLLEMGRRLTPAGIIALPMNRRDIADYLGLTLETVSRALSVLKKRGFLKFLGQTQRDCSSESRWPRRTGCLRRLLS